MPIYEYQCTQCGHRLETMQKMSEAPLTDCPECGKPKLQKLISAAGFQLKGTGWYATDFKNKGKSDTSKKSDSSDSSSKTTESKSTDTKSSGSQTKSDT